jgi:hypothetical protein
VKGFITSENHILKYTSKHGRFLPINSLKNGVCVSELDTPKTGWSEKKQKPSETCGFLGFKLWPNPTHVSRILQTWFQGTNLPLKKHRS